MNQLVSQIPPLLLVDDVLLPFGAVFGAAGHHDLQRLLFQLGAQLDQRVADVHADAAAHIEGRERRRREKDKGT